MHIVGSPADLIYKASRTVRTVFSDNLISCVAYTIQNASAFYLIMHYAFYILHSIKISVKNNIGLVKRLPFCYNTLDIEEQGLKL